MNLKLKIIDKESQLKLLEISLKEDKNLLEDKKIIEEYSIKKRKLEKEIYNFEKIIKKIKSGKSLYMENSIYVEGGKYKPSFANEEKEVFDIEVCKYPTTQKMWLEIMESNPSQFKGDKKALETVSWWEALEYCNKLSKKYGLKTVYDLSRSSQGILNDKRIEWKNSLSK